MKKVLSLVAAVGLIAASSAAFGKTIVNSKHDLSPSGTYNAGTYTRPGAYSTQICVYCHAPHNAVQSLPLWNRSNPAGGGFTLYSGINMQNTSFKSGFTADSTSLFCMSCHDGATNLNNVHNSGAILNPGTTDRTNLDNLLGGKMSDSGSPANLGTDLSTTHPINFPVSTVDGQSDLNVGSGTTMGPGVTPGAGYTFGIKFPLFKSSRTTVATFGRSLECGSCHSVHDSQNSPFLRDTMNGSQLCLGCHNK